MLDHRADFSQEQSPTMLSLASAADSWEVNASILRPESGGAH